MEVSSQLENNGSLEIQSEYMKPKSHLEPEVLPADLDVMVEASKEEAGESDVHLVEKSDKIMDLKDETIEQKGEDLFIMTNLLIHSIQMKL